MRSGSPDQRARGFPALFYTMTENEEQTITPEQVEAELRAIVHLWEGRKAAYKALRASEDHLILWVYQLASKRDTKGIGGATQALERVGKRIDALEERSEADAIGGEVFPRWPWYTED